MAKTHWQLRIRTGKDGHIKQCRKPVQIAKGRYGICGQIYEEIVIRGKRVAKKRCLSHLMHTSVVKVGKSKSPQAKAGKSIRRTLRNAA